MMYMYHGFLIHSSADGHLGCFHVLAIINSAVMNIGVHMSLSDLVSSVCRPSTFLTKISIELEQEILKFVKKHKRPGMTETIWRKNRAEGITLPEFRLYNKSTVIIIVWYWHTQKRHIYQWSRIES